MAGVEVTSVVVCVRRSGGPAADLQARGRRRDPPCRAEEAGVPLASTTYYFDSLDDLLDGALQLFVDEEAGRLTALVERLEGHELPPVEIARLFQAELEPDVAQFELYAEAARRPHLREVARRSIELYATVAATALRAAGLGEPAINPRAFVALFDGYGLHASPAATIRGSRTP
jgi:TetR/AcrR family transcriptional regulator, regulator of biofilm formation and stress response